MFEIWNIICLITSLSGSPVNSCAVEELEMKFKSMPRCIAVVAKEQDKARRELVKQFGDEYIVSVMSLCVESDENV